VARDRKEESKRRGAENAENNNREKNKAERTKNIEHGAADVFRVDEWIDPVYPLRPLRLCVLLFVVA
jgi:hypothetical protein